MFLNSLEPSLILDPLFWPFTAACLPPKLFTTLNLHNPRRSANQPVQPRTTRCRHAQYWNEQSHLSFNDIRHMAKPTVPKAHQSSLLELQRLLENVEASDMTGFGFESEADFKTMLNTSIGSLATSVCVAQKGYCLLDDSHQLQVLMLCVVERRQFRALDQAVGGLQIILKHEERSCIPCHSFARALCLLDKRGLCHKG